MLRIQKIFDGRSTVIQLCGRVTAPNCLEISKQIETSTGATLLDLAEVTLIDLSSIQFLAKCEAAGMELRHCPLYVREWISRETTASAMFRFHRFS